MKPQNGFSSIPVSELFNRTNKNQHNASAALDLSSEK